MKYRISIDVVVDPRTTRLTAKEHAQQVCDTIRRTVGDGILTAHEPEAEIEVYSIKYEVPGTAG